MKMTDPNTFVKVCLAKRGLQRENLRGLGRTRITRWSDKQPGFGVREYVSGKRMYIVQQEMDGKTRTVTIANAELVSEYVALDIARRILYRAVHGPNPADEKIRRRKAPFFQAFLEDYWQRVSPTWKPSTLKAENINRRVYLEPLFPDRGIDEIKRSDVEKWYDEMCWKRSPGGATRAFQRLRAVMNKAEEWGVRPQNTNPCTGVRVRKGKKMNRYLRPREYHRLGSAIAGFQNDWPIHSRALLVIILTGCRLSEITHLRWREVSGDRLFLEDAKTGARTVALSQEARAVIEQQPVGEAHHFVFSADGERPVYLAGYWRMVRSEAGLENVRIHDLRHSFASQAARLSLPLPVTGKLLGHVKIESTARYTHFDDQHLLRVADRISAFIESVV